MRLILFLLAVITAIEIGYSLIAGKNNKNKKREKEIEKTHAANLVSESDNAESHRK